mgnify:CR=1 FL=1
MTDEARKGKKYGEVPWRFGLLEPAPAAPAIDNELIDLLGAAWKAASRDEEGYAKLQEVGQIVGSTATLLRSS